VVGALLAWLAVGIVAVTATGTLLARDWRWNLGFMAAQYWAQRYWFRHTGLGMAAALW
jgi:hypothetical protein